ncbi:MAG: tetratricopeptide repeat protein, partial [Desulfobacteraceae bacterium]|nr:tetratricopeptide repeat protein [Desulfobacteraceae bacterium]
DALPNINNHYGKTLIFSTLSDIFLSLKNMEQAEEYLEKSIEQADLTDNSHITAFTLNNKGNFLFADGDDYGAITAYEKCYEKCVEITEPSADILGLASKCSINKLRAKLESETDENIVSELAHAISQAGRQPNSHSKSSDFITLSILAQKIGKKPDYSHRINPSLVYSLLSKAIKIAEHTQDIRMACYAYGYMGNLYENEEQYTEAIQLTRNAIFTAQQGHFPELLYLWQWQLGRLFKTEGDIDSAVSTYKDAVNILTPGSQACETCENDDSDKTYSPGIINELFKGYRKSRRLTFDEKVKPVYLELAELLMQQANTVQDGKENKLLEI